MSPEFRSATVVPRIGAVIRGVLLALFVAGVLLSIGDLVLPAPNGFTRTLRVEPQTNIVTVTESRWLQVAGGAVQNGERLTVESAVYAALRRYPVYLLGSIAAVTPDGTAVRLSDERPSRYQWVWASLIRVVVELIAVVLLALRGRRPGVAAIAVVLFNGQFFYFAAPDTFLGTAWIALYYLIQDPILTFDPWILLLAAARLSPPSRLNRWLPWAVGIASVANAAYKVVTKNADVGTYLRLSYLDAALLVIALAVFFLNAARTHGGERRRLLILGASLVVGQSILLYGVVPGGAGVYGPLQNTIALVSTAIMTGGLAYALLVERMFDIGFVINRAAVYAATSALLVFAFIAIEFFVSKVTSGIGSTGGVIVELGLAAAVGVSLRPIHQRVDDGIDQVFFGARHRAANELLAFADECPEYRSHAALFDAALKTLRLYARPLSCALYIADGRGDLTHAAGDASASDVLSADHPAVVRLRTSRRILERSAFPLLDQAEIAVPMLRPRELAGAILLTLPANAEPYSPEERNALFVLAQKLGAAADATHLTAELAELRLRLAAFQHGAVRDLEAGPP